MTIWMLLASVAVIAAAIAAVTRSNNKDNKIIRHTVEVNLGILTRELDAVAPLAASLTGGDLVRANWLIAHCKEVIAETEPLALYRANHSRLGYFLTRVFRAMDSSSELHRLLIKNDLLKPTAQSAWHLE